MMRDSTIDPNWLRQMMAANPPQRAENGNLLTGPVRLAFPELWRPKKGKRDDGSETSKYSANILFPLGANLDLFSEEWTRIAKQDFPQNWTPQGQPVGIHSPFHDQVEKTVGVKVYARFTPGAIYLNVTSNYKPAVVDDAMNPIVDESRVYGGVWAIVAVNAYSYKPQKGNAGKTGIAFGLQSVVIIANDQKLGGGGSDPRQDFKGISITADSDISSRMAGLPGTPVSAPPTQGIMPGGGFQGTQGALPVQPLPVAESAESLW